jgi:hypothetical protein
MLRDADALLNKVRAVVPDAAGVVLCDDRAHARASAKLLRTIGGEKPVVVVSDEAGAHARIDRFARAGAGASFRISAPPGASTAARSRSPSTLRRTSTSSCGFATPWNAGPSSAAG